MTARGVASPHPRRRPLSHLRRCHSLRRRDFPPSLPLNRYQMPESLTSGRRVYALAHKDTSRVASAIAYRRRSAISSATSLVSVAASDDPLHEVAVTGAAALAPHPPSTL